MQKTTFIKKEKALQNKKWYIVDATDKILGRLAVEVANLLRGKNKADFTPNVDCGDYVIIINSDKVILSSNKGEREKWYSHSGYIGGLRERTGDEMIEKYSDELVYDAIKGMLPKNRLSNQIIKKLHVYKTAEYTQKAQKPIEYKLEK
ncbi:MAG: 50S ribosomal protein L13 [Malacoplasma sp.]|nr:50S ribosomal protein L13 [Malacoplasma sp.]